MSLDVTDDQPTLVQVMGGVARQQAITWANVGPDLSRHMLSLGQNEFKYPQWWLGVLRVVQHFNG